MWLPRRRRTRLRTGRPFRGPARGAYLYKVADILEGNLDSLATEMTREEGKTVPEAKGETMRSINIFRYFAGEGSRIPGIQVPSERDRVFMYAVRRPLGVVSQINPWNFPSAIPAWKLAPALIAGNSVLVKPATAAPLSAWRIAEACHQAGIPKGVVNLLCGSGGEVGDAMVHAEPVKAVSFTGSVPVGKLLHAAASTRRIRIQLEMGGKNPTIVLADADLDKAVANTVNAAMFSTGQKCTATSRVIVEDAIHDEFLDRVVRATRSLRVGDGAGGRDRCRTGDRPGSARHERAVLPGRGERRGDARVRRPGPHRREPCQGLLLRADRVQRRDRRHADRPGGSVRAGAGGDAGSGLRRVHADRELHRIRPLSIDPDA